jgi:Holliday junction resolvase-like predicted endonuclease
MKSMRQFHVAVAAEAFAAGLLAQAGCDVSVQYGANQPEYDLIASKGDRFLKISVKGSQDGGWGLIAGYKKPGVSYAQAASLWAAAQSPKVIYCFVQFQHVPLGTCPSVYLATVADVAEHLTACRNGNGTTTLSVSYTYKKGIGMGYSDIIPPLWSFTLSRLDDLFAAHG